MLYGRQYLRLTIAALMVASGTLLAGCATKTTFGTFGAPGAPAAEGEGACSAFERPPYQILGKTAYDQLWSNRITEAGIAGCAWARPAERPASINAPVPLPKAKPASKKKSKKWLQMLRSKKSEPLE